VGRSSLRRRTRRSESSSSPEGGQRSETQAPAGITRELDLSAEIPPNSLLPARTDPYNPEPVREKVRAFLAIAPSLPIKKHLICPGAKAFRQAKTGPSQTGFTRVLKA
jgi:hypothetical protein